jgi:Na+-transporting NADH:ubiquinone oxidoreductase subunit A
LPKRFSIRKGLDIPIGGEPEQVITDGPEVSTVALLGVDYHGLRPALLVEEGDRVKLGQPVFEDRKRPEIRFVASSSGTVTQINRGPRRALHSVVIEREDHGEVEFSAHSPNRLARLPRNDVAKILLASGLWTSFRTRPYSRVPDPRSEPHSIFVSAIDTNPLSANPQLIIGEHREDFSHGLTVISRLTRGPVFLCKEQGGMIPAGDMERTVVAEFDGPHPAGLAGTHIHFLDPVGAQKTVWHLNYQDVIGIGKLFTTGRLWGERIIALAGPLIHRPRLIRTTLGANLSELLRGETREGKLRVISGSILSGHTASGALSYLGRYHNQVSVIAEAGTGPDNGTGGRAGYSANKLPIPGGFGKREFDLTTAMHGTSTAFVPTTAFERMMPLDILPAPLLRALIVGDTDMAEALGCLELDEEDLALCTFVCPGKWDYGPLLRSSLDRIEKTL